MNNRKYNVLVACEESQVVTVEFRKRGFTAYSCDLQNPSGKQLEYHILGDAIRLLKTPVTFRTMDGKKHQVSKWHLLIAHPPCTYICKASAVRMFKDKILNTERYNSLLQACDFFMEFLNAPIELVCVENPVPLRIAPIPRPSTYIEPYWFGEPYSKKTCLWLKNLPPLLPTIISTNYEKWVNGGNSYKTQKRGKVSSQKMRSRTFQKVAEQFAKQYGDYMIEYYKQKQKTTNKL